MRDMSFLPFADVGRVATQTVNNGTVTVVIWDTENEDSDAMFTASSTDVTIQTAGVYMITVQITFSDFGAAATRHLVLVKVGGVEVAREERAACPTMMDCPSTKSLCRQMPISCLPRL